LISICGMSKNLYFDYDAVQEKQILYEGVTALWTGYANEERCWKLVSQSVSKFEALGGMGTEESRGKISLGRPNRQWDYPLSSTGAF
jgi:alpha,alpha-trehalase